MVTSQPSTLVVIYSCGDFTAASKVVRSDNIAAKIEINRDGCLPPNKVAAFFLPETKGKTLEEIEAHFEGKR